MGIPARFGNRVTRALCLVALLAGSVPGGCVHQFAEYPQRDAMACVATARDGELVLGADPVFDSRAAQDYFEVDLPNNGVLAVYVVVENHAQGRSHLVSPTGFSLGGVENQAGKHSTGSDAPGAVVAWTGAVAGSLLIAGIGIAMVVDTKNSQTNFNRKALQTQTIAPGERVAGFVYFPLDKDRKKWPGEWVLRFTESEGSTPVEVHFTQKKGSP